MSIITAIIAGLFVWFICSYVESVELISENGFIIGAITAFGLWIYPKLS